MESGVASNPIVTREEYDHKLRDLMGLDNKMVRRMYEMARLNTKRVVFSETNHLNMLKAAENAYAEGICHPILLGNEEKIAKIAKENQISLNGIEIVNLRHDREEERRARYAKKLAEKRARQGMTFHEASEKMFERSYFGMMMVDRKSVV